MLYGLQNGENAGVDFTDPPVIDRAELSKCLPEKDESGAVHLKMPGLTLTDFYHLGVDGSEYKTWFEVGGSTD